jgi:hypothetical protein
VATASWGKVAQVLVHQWGCRDGIAAELWLQTGDLIPCPPATTASQNGASPPTGAATLMVDHPFDRLQKLGVGDIRVLKQPHMCCRRRGYDRPRAGDS